MSLYSDMQRDFDDQIMYIDLKNYRCKFRKKYFSVYLGCFVYVRYNLNYEKLCIGEVSLNVILVVNKCSLLLFLYKKFIRS